MKLTDLKYNTIKIKGAICLFLFLLLYQSGFSQTYTIQLFSDKTINKNLAKKYSFTKKYKDSVELENELSKSLNLLRSEGYLSASYDSIIYDSLNVKAFLFLGKQYFCSDINIISNDIDLTKYRSSVEKIKKGSFDLIKLQALYNEILSDLENNGYPFAQIIPEDVKFMDYIVDMGVLVKKGQQFRYNELFIKGSSKISKHYIKRYISVFKDNPYNEKSVSAISDKLEEISFITILKPPEVEFYENKADIYLYLDKRKANLFNGIVGFANDDDDTGVAFTGEFDLRLINNFNRGENFGIHWKGTGKGSQKLTASLIYPYLFKSPFSLNLNFSLDKKDTTFLALRSNFGISYSFKNNDKIKISYSGHNSRIISGSLSDHTIWSDANTYLIGLAYMTENIDYGFNPRKGYLFHSEIANGKRASNDIKNAYFEFYTLIDAYVPLYRNLILKLKTDNKFAFSDEIQYENELFRIGGFNSLRGFSEDNFSVSEYSILTLELRYLYEKNSNVFLFTDAARLRFRTNVQNTIKYPYSFGIGTNLSTKAGIFNISYALGTIDKNAFQLSNSKIHIGYVNRF